MATKTRPFVCDLKDLEALHSESVTVFRCAHHWVSCMSIMDAMLSGKIDDPAIPWTDKTHRARRIATIASMMNSGVEFPPLYVKVTRRYRFRRALKFWSTHIEIELGDGHHRLRALQFLGRVHGLRLDVAGRLDLLQKLMS